MKKHFLTVVIFVLAVMILPRAIKAQTTTDVIINSHINKLMMLERMKRNAAKKRATNKSSYRKSAKNKPARKRTRRG
ncbi:MAG: hypothetical protein H7Z37_09890 [Pyrinomonadaceae bacterium]|nr:hypothetical protein [Pyrinomonadaceae bacterium]